MRRGLRTARVDAMATCDKNFEVAATGCQSSHALAARAMQSDVDGLQRDRTPRMQKRGGAHPRAAAQGLADLAPPTAARYNRPGPLGLEGGREPSPRRGVSDSAVSQRRSGKRGAKPTLSGPH